MRIVVPGERIKVTNLFVPRRQLNFAATESYGPLVTRGPAWTAGYSVVDAIEHVVGVRFPSSEYTQQRVLRGGWPPCE